MVLLRNAIRPLRQSPGKWHTTTVLPWKLRCSSGSTSLPRDQDQPAKPHVGIVQTTAGESVTTCDQLEDLFAGRFPADCADEVIHLHNLPRREFHKVVDAFDTFGNEDGRRPSGHLFFNRKLSKISVHLAPTILHDCAIRKIENSFLDVIRSSVPNYDELFALRTNSGELAPADFTTKRPDVMICHAPDAATISSPFFLAGIGVSENYPDLAKSVKYWLEGDEKIKLAFLVKFTESPEFSGHECYTALPSEVVNNAQRYANDRKGFKLDESEGMLWAHGAPVVGRLRAFLEIWGRKADSDEVAPRGERIHFYNSLEPANPSNVVVDFEEFGISVEELRGKQVCVNWDSWVATISRARRELAWERFRKLL